MKKEEFDSYFEKLFRQDDPENYYLLYGCFQRTLKKFNLDKFYQPEYILIEAYFRGVKALKKGKTINTLSSWIRGTGLNYIRELNREKSKTKSFEELSPKESKYVTESLNLLQQDGSLEDQSEKIKNKVKLLKKALKKLTPEQQKLLNYKAVEKFSWKEIESFEEYLGTKLPTLRKRKERIVKKLLKFFHSHSIVKL